MYFMFVRHGILPSAFYKMSHGEKVILRAFMLQEIEEDKNAVKEIENMSKGG
ncbi:MAG: hypothetical protein PUB60_04715 [Veillonellaceae bacterium]|nr:hypothetical protein [Veillonellaceae bacterium]